MFNYVTQIRRTSLISLENHYDENLTPRSNTGNTWTCSSCSEINPKNSKRCSRCHEGKGSKEYSVSAEDVDEQFETRPYDKRCSFAIGMSESQLESSNISHKICIVFSMKVRTIKRLLRALRRGIGIHHSAMRTAYLRTVEILFRLEQSRQDRVRD